MNNDRTPVLDALNRLSPVSWYLVLASIRTMVGVIGLHISPDPTPEADLTAAIDSELAGAGVQRP